MSIEVLGNEAITLFKQFGWYSIALVVATTVLMIPINSLLKLIMKKEGLQRLRKTLSTLLVFVVASGVVALLTAFITKHEITLQYLIAGALPCGFLAQGLWVIFKLTKDYGFKFIAWLGSKIFVGITKNKEFKKSLEKMGVNMAIIGIIADEVKDIKVADMSEYLAKEGEIGQKIRTQLSGFVNAESLETAVRLCLDKIKEAVKPELAKEV